MFPPEIIAPTLFPLNLSSFRMAARTIAPDNYTIIFILSKKSFDASIISLSLTRMMSPINLFSISKVILPILVLTPSARVKGGY